MEGFFAHDSLTLGTKGVVYIGDKILAYRRSHDAPNHPDELDMPGGAPEPGETPFQTFQREVYEEFSLRISPENIVYSKRHESTMQPGKFGWHAVAKLPASAEGTIVFGDEGEDFRLMPLEEFMARADATDFLKERTAQYLNSLNDHLR